MRAQAVADALAFAAHAAAIQTRLGRSDVAIAPGIEIRSAGDLTVDGSWNLFADFPTVRQGGLTLRAAGDLVIAGNLSDGFSEADPSGLLLDGLSWNLRLVAGADLDAANALGVTPRELLGTGGSVIVGASGAAALVRTGTGDIDLRAADGLKLSDKASVIYTAGSLDTAALADFTPRAGAYYARRGGDLRIAVGGDIVSVPSEQLVTEWLWRWGTLEEANLAFFAPGDQPTWWVQHDRFQQGVGVLGGGDVTVRAGGKISNLAVVQPSMGRVQGGRTSTEARTLVVQNGGLMNVTADGDISGGLYYTARGEANIAAAAFTVGRTIKYTYDGNRPDVFVLYPIAPILALGDTVMNVSSAGSMTIQTALEPLMARIDSENRGIDYRHPKWITYTDRTALNLISTSGDITLVNQAIWLFDRVGYENVPRALPGALYPSKLVIAALNGSIISMNGRGVNSGNGLVMTPGLNNNLLLAAENDVLFSDIVQSRLPLALLPRPTAPYVPDDTKSFMRNGGGNFSSIYVNALLNPDVLDLVDDYQPTRIYARTGSIEHLYARAGASINPSVQRIATLHSNEQVWLRAGRDIRGVDLDIRNNHLTDVSLLEAGNDFLMTSSGGDGTGRVSVRGPGAIVIQAGRDVYFEKTRFAGQGYLETTGNYRYYERRSEHRHREGLAAGRRRYRHPGGDQAAAGLCRLHGGVSRPGKCRGNAGLSASDSRPAEYAAAGALHRLGR